MKHLVTMAVFYFLTTNSVYWIHQVGPFRTQRDCDAIRAWTMTRGVSVSACWEAPQ